MATPSKRAAKTAKKRMSTSSVAAESPVASKKAKTTPNSKHTTLKGKEKEEVPIAVKVDVEWTHEELSTLLSNITMLLPKTDDMRYDTAARKLSWEKVKFGNFNSHECSSKWDDITKKLRRYRTLTELLGDAKEWAKHPWASYSGSKKTKPHPDMPKKPLTPYFRYFLEKRQKYMKLHPEMSMTDLAKIIASKFKELSEKKKAKYQQQYRKECEVYKERLEEFKSQHPEMVGMWNKTKKPRIEGIDKPKTPFQLFRADRLGKIGDIDNATRSEAVEKIKHHWSTLSEAKRIKWIRKAVLDLARYNVELEEYCSKHVDFKAPVLKPSITKAERDLKDKFDGKPDKPPNSGYSLYSKIMMKELTDLPNKEKMGEISKRWKTLNGDERDSYSSQSIEMNNTYKIQFEEFLSNLLPEERENALAKPKKNKVKIETISDDVNDIINFAEGKPSEPNTPLYHFQSEKIIEYEQKYPSYSKVDLITLIAQDFQALSSKKKGKYEKKVSKLTLTKILNVETKKKLLMKNEPKKPPQNAYGLFSSEMLRELTDIEPRKRMTEISKRWKELTAKQKAAYKERANLMVTKYKTEYDEFLKSLAPKECDEFNALTKEKKGKAANNSKALSSDESSSDDSSSSSGDSDSSDDAEKKASSSDDSSSDSDSDDKDSALDDYDSDSVEEAKKSKKKK